MVELRKQDAEKFLKKLCSQRKGFSGERPQKKRSTAFLGTIFYDTDNNFVAYFLLFLLLLSLIATVVACMYEKGRGLFILSIGTFFVIWTAATAFVATMSIANEWI